MQLHNTSRLYTRDPDMTIEHGRILYPDYFY